MSSLAPLPKISWERVACWVAWHDQSAGPRLSQAIFKAHHSIMQTLGWPRHGRLPARMQRSEARARRLPVLGSASDAPDGRNHLDMPGPDIAMGRDSATASNKQTAGLSCWLSFKLCLACTGDSQALGHFKKAWYAARWPRSRTHHWRRLKMKRVTDFARPFAPTLSLRPRGPSKHSGPWYPIAPL